MDFSARDGAACSSVFDAFEHVHYAYHFVARVGLFESILAPKATLLRHQILTGSVACPAYVVSGDLMSVKRKRKNIDVLAQFRLGWG